VRIRFVAGLALLVLLALVTPAAAQAADVNNPTAVQFTASADHASVTGYTLDILRADGTVLQTLDLGKPVPAATTNLCTVAMNVQPITFGVGYSVRVRAYVAATPANAVSDWALSSNKFNRVPGKPGAVTVQ
jgi:hypothetical protein